ncbi:hypothetical protein L3X38_039085 [Prunus dulcis]|uniref:Uncharacterized protein n=1 Tax=Prunus dulcis TaxID=3755 RepID=A0AAD4V811_PRUDU|nr:hypothetical protein L3X38_039085 [Prunus dulcis]
MFAMGRVSLSRSYNSVHISMRRQSGRSSRQASDTDVVPAEGSPMLKSAISGNFGTVSLEIRFRSRELRQVVAASEECLPLAWRKACLPWC